MHRSFYVVVVSGLWLVGAGNAVATPNTTGETLNPISSLFEGGPIPPDSHSPLPPPHVPMPPSDGEGSQPPPHAPLPSSDNESGVPPG